MPPLHMNYSFSVQNVQRKQAHDSHPRLLDEGNISYVRQTNPCPLTPSTVPLVCPGGGKHVSSIKQHASESDSFKKQFCYGFGWMLATKDLSSDFIKSMSVY